MLAHRSIAIVRTKYRQQFDFSVAVNNPDPETSFFLGNPSKEIKAVPVSNIQ
jgi:hypothetical protein